jgi:hypothetical protein
MRMTDGGREGEKERQRDAGEEGVAGRNGGMRVREWSE